MHYERLSDVCMALNSIRQTYSVCERRERVVSKRVQYNLTEKTEQRSTCDHGCQYPDTYLNILRFYDTTTVK
jgi:hypothetical protein